MAALDETPRPLRQIPVSFTPKFVRFDAVLDARPNDEFVVLIPGRGVDETSRDEGQRFGRSGPTFRRPRSDRVQQQVLPRERHERRRPHVPGPTAVSLSVAIEKKKQNEMINNDDEILASRSSTKGREGHND